MLELIIFVVIVVVAVVIAKALRGKSISESLSKSTKVNEYKYIQKKFFMSRAEHECFDAILKAVGNQYHVFPQVHLSLIVDNEVKSQNWKGAFKHINQKSVDFVLCDKDFISPKLAIELDDKTHERKDRIIRDKEVERILEEAGLPLLRLENHGHFDPIELSQKIKMYEDNKVDFSEKEKDTPEHSEKG